MRPFIQPGIDGYQLFGEAQQVGGVGAEDVQIALQVAERRVQLMRNARCKVAEGGGAFAQ